MARFRTSLAIGGTGMLASATRYLASCSDRTYIVARHASAFRDCHNAVPIDADWNSPTFSENVSAVLQSAPSIECALLWIRDPKPVLVWLARYLERSRVVRVLGSLNGKPEIPVLAGQTAIVRLGSKATSAGRRWLTHEEIGAGATASIDDGQSRVVGELTSI